MTEKTTNTRTPFKGNNSNEIHEHMRAAREEFRKSMEGFFPPEFREHHSKARKEILLAWRSMIDASLEKVDNKK